MTINKIYYELEAGLKYRKLKEQTHQISYELMCLIDDLGIDDSDEYTDSRMVQSLEKVADLFLQQERKLKNIVRDKLESSLK